MSEQTRSPEAQSRRNGIQLVIGLAALMWVLEIIDAIAGGRLDSLGIEPRDTDGLTGIVAAPFLHGGFGHLLGNTVTFVILGVLVAFGGLMRVVAVTAIVALVSGLGTWLIAPADSVHIGASGVVFGYATYLITRGLFNRDLTQLVVGLVVGAVLGATLIGGLEPQQGISWQGHLFGALGGILAARLLMTPRATEKNALPAS